MSGTVNSGGSSMPPSNQVKIVKATPKNIQPPINSQLTGAGAVPETPIGAGAPSMAPSQAMIATGQGAVGKGTDAHPPQPTMEPQPASNGSTAPIENGPSVDYDTQQGSRIPADILHHPTAVVPLGEQDQRT